MSIHLQIERFLGTDLHELCEINAPEKTAQAVKQKRILTKVEEAG